MQAYLACITFADAQLGAVLDLLEKSRYADNTIVIFWSDHGWHHGTKAALGKADPLGKNAPLQTICHKDSGSRVFRQHLNAGRLILLNVFPTLISLCGLPAREGLAMGHDMTPLFENPQAKWEYPAITEIKVGNVAVRTEYWWYIHYLDAQLKNFMIKPADVYDWYNLADDEKYKDVIEIHRKWIPDSFAKPVPSKEQYYFDPGTYTYMDRQTGAMIDGKKIVSSRQYEILFGWKDDHTYVESLIY